MKFWVWVLETLFIIATTFLLKNIIGTAKFLAQRYFLTVLLQISDIIPKYFLWVYRSRWKKHLIHVRLLLNFELYQTCVTWVIIANLDKIVIRARWAYRYCRKVHTDTLGHTLRCQNVTPFTNTSRSISTMCKRHCLVSHHQGINFPRCNHDLPKSSFEGSVSVIATGVSFMGCNDCDNARVRLRWRNVEGEVEGEDSRKRRGRGDEHVMWQRELSSILSKPTASCSG